MRDLSLRALRVSHDEIVETLFADIPDIEAAFEHVGGDDDLGEKLLDNVFYACEAALEIRSGVYHTSLGLLRIQKVIETLKLPEHAQVLQELLAAQEQGEEILQIWQNRVRLADWVASQQVAALRCYLRDFRNTGPEGTVQLSEISASLDATFDFLVELHASRVDGSQHAG